MKELAIEEKAKRYEEALEKARQLCTYPTTQPFISDLQDLFPELAESEDERIRQELINFVKSRLAGFPQCEKYIAWLEKQKDNKDIHLLELKAKAYDDAKERMSYAYNQNRVPIGFINEIFPDIMLYEKQCKPKDSNSIYPHFGKPTDKVEPKFHEGDWVVTDKGDTVQIGTVNNDYYTIGNGMLFSMPYVDTSWHLWTIKDAKAGDVLVDKSNNREYPFLFKETKPSNIKTNCLNPLTILGYCGIGGAGFTKSEGWGDTANCTYYPATKEQRDLLFQKMKEDGYEWNADEKVVNKVIIYE